MSTRGPAEEGGKAVYTDERESYQNEKKEECEDKFGGHGVLGTPEEYMKVLKTVLTSGEDEKLLKKETAKLLFEGQMNEGGSTMLSMTRKSHQMLNDALCGLPLDVETDYTLGGMLALGDEPGARKAGTLVWGGLPNLFWVSSRSRGCGSSTNSCQFVDPTTGLAGLYAGQVTPPGDAKCAVVSRKFEAGIYDLYEKSKKAGSSL